MTLRSKSTSHIFDIRTERNKKNSQENNSITTEDKYSAYTVEDFAARRKRFSSGNVVGESRRTQTANRSQNFVKRIIASFESKNEVCAANDEFFTTYCRGCCNQANSDSHCSFNNDDKLETSVKMKRNETETRVPAVSSEIEASEIRSEEYRGKLKNLTLLNVPVEDHELVRSNAVERRRNVVVLDRNDSVRSTAVTFNGEETNFTINENDKRHRKSDYVQCDWKNGGYGAKACYDPSTFDPRRDRVELQNREHVVATSSYVFESGPNNRKANTLERIICKSELTNRKLNEKDSRRNTAKKRLKGRNRFFKCFFGSVIKWRKSEAKDRSQRFMLHDDLFDETNRLRRKSKKKSRSSPCRTIVFQENLELETNEHKATIHPIYEGRRNKRLARKNEDRKRLMIQGNMENVVRPSAIKNIIKQLSQFS